MEAVVKVTNYNRPPPSLLSTQTSQLCSVKLKRTQSVRKVIKKRMSRYGKETMWLMSARASLVFSASP